MRQAVLGGCGAPWWRVRVAVGGLVLAAALMIFVGSAGASPHFVELVAPGLGPGGPVTFSADGSKRFFVTAAALVPGDTDGQIDVYQETNGQFTLISTGPTGGNGAQDAGIGFVSNDGSHVVFSTTESLVAADTDTTPDLYVWSNNVTQLVTQASGPDPAHNSVSVAGASADGSVLYLSAQPFQVFGGISFYRFSAGQLTSLNLTSPSFSNSYGPGSSICATSADGATIYVNTYANIAPSDTDPQNSGAGGRKDLYRIIGGQATLVSAGPAGSSAPFDAFCAGASTDGARVFFTTAEALVPQDGDSTTDLYMWEGGVLSLISIGNGPSDVQSYGISPDGSTALYTSYDPLVAADTDAQADFYRWHNGQTTLVSLGPDGGNGSFDASFAGSSADLSVVYFTTQEALVASDTNGDYDLYESKGGQTTLVPQPQTGNGCGIGGVVPGTGDLVFATDVPLVPSDTDANIDVYVWDGSAFSRVSPGNGAFDACPDGTSGDGTEIAFDTSESLLPEDTNGVNDIYIARPAPPESGGGSIVAGGTVSTGTTPSSEDPLETSVTSPSGGTATIAESDVTGSDPAGFHLLGMQAVITVNVSPAPTAANPLTIVFDLDGSLLADAGVDYTNVQVLKDGAQVQPCTTSTPANPDPCISQRAPLAGGGAEITVRTSSASIWTFAKQLQPTDTTAPKDAPIVTGTLGTNGWYRSDVSVAWHWADEVGGSGVDTANCTQTSGSGGAQGAAILVSSSCKDLAGNATSDSRTFKIDKTAPTLAVPANIAVNATSPAGATVTYLAGVGDAGGSGVASSSCSPSAGSLFAIGTTTVHCTATDKAGNSSSASFTVHVNGAAEQLASLFTAVNAIGPGSALAGKIQQVQGYVAAGDKADACAGLSSFIGLVASQKGKKVTVAQATSFTTQANSIRATLGC